MSRPKMSFNDHKPEVTKYVIEKYKGKVKRLAINNDPMLGNAVYVFLEFLIPIDEADELEVYRRIIQVIDVVTEEEPNNVS
jgi:hypothetical protein